MILLVIYCLLFTYLFIQCLQLGMAYAVKPDEPKQWINEAQWPTIAILVAARNEESNIAQCLQSLIELDYPKEKLVIWVGNDQSEDHTESLVNDFIKTHPQVNLLNILTNLGTAKGKANVLAQLAHKTNADYFLITDADITVQPTWAKTMVLFCHNQVDLVSGTTLVKGTNLFGTCQQIDWLYFMHAMLTFTKIGLPATAVGNNMIIARKAYFKTGGYENIPFSITEDYKLFSEVRKTGGKTLNVFNTNSINQSKPLQTLHQLLHQRKRWLTGAQELPGIWWGIFFVFGMFYPGLLFLMMYQFKTALLLWLIKFWLQCLIVTKLNQSLGIKNTTKQFLQYEIYSLLQTISTGLFYILPQKVNWKNRTY